MEKESIIKIHGRKENGLRNQIRMESQLCKGNVLASFASVVLSEIHLVSSKNGVSKCLLCSSNYYTKRKKEKVFYIFLLLCLPCSKICVYVFLGAMGKLELHILW